MPFMLLLLLALSADTDAETVLRVRAGGASFPAELYRRLWALYGSQTDSRIEFDYTTIGSTEGKRWITGRMENQPHSIDFAGSDTPLADMERFPHLTMIPTVAGAIVLVFNLPGVSVLTLSEELTADIFLGNVTRWNHPAIVALNDGVKLPDEPILLIARRDSSGSTEVLTSALSTFKEEWLHGYGVFKKAGLVGPSGPSTTWPLDGRHLFAYADGTQAVASLVRSIPYSLGYSSAATAVTNSLQQVTFISRGGRPIPPAEVGTGVQLVIDAHAQLNPNEGGLIIDLTNVSAEGGYPIATYTYVIINMTTNDSTSCAKAMLMVRVLKWSLNDPIATAETNRLHFVPLSTKMIANVEAILDRITCNGNRVTELIAQEDIERNTEQWTGLQMTVFACLLLLVFVAIPGTVLFHLYRRRMIQNEWLLKSDQLDFGKAQEEMRQSTNSNHAPLTTFVDVGASQYAIYTGCRSFYKAFQFSALLYRDAVSAEGGIQPYEFSAQDSRQMGRLCRGFTNRNLAKLIGLVVLDKVPSMSKTLAGVYHVYEDQDKATLHQLLDSCPYQLNNTIRYSLAIDVCRAMGYLNSNGIIHGFLDTWVCLVDSNWTVKVANWAQTHAANSNTTTHYPLMTIDGLTLDDGGDTLKRLVFAHPSLLAGAVALGDTKEQHDLYSIGMVLVEIFNQKLPFNDFAQQKGWMHTIQLLANQPEHVPLSLDAPDGIQLVVAKLTGKETRPTSNNSSVIYHFRPLQIVTTSASKELPITATTYAT